jgi:hypothetical protein
MLPQPLGYAASRDLIAAPTFHIPEILMLPGSRLATTGNPPPRGSHRRRSGVRVAVDPSVLHSQ